MNSLWKILLSGFALFMVLAIAQEWTFFSSAWFGEVDESVPVESADREAAVTTLRETLNLMRHLYKSGGDRRFVERMSISDGLREEIMSDIAYLSRNHRRQDPLLLRLEIERAEALGEDRVEIRTREFWQFRWHSLVDGEQTDDPRWQVLRGRYLTRRTSRGWQVDSWEFVLDAPPAAGDPDA